jgi:hypothetical protein
MKYAVMAVAGVLVGGAAALGIGCEPTNKLDVSVEEGPSAPHPNLPAVPTLPPPPAPVTYPDGAYSIYGVRHVAARNWSKQVRVRGYIAKVYVPMVPGVNPPRVCGERDHCLEEKPHIYIADTAGETDPEKLMMVTGHASSVGDRRRAPRRGLRPPGGAGGRSVARGRGPDARDPHRLVRGRADHRDGHAPPPREQRPGGLQRARRLRERHDGHAVAQRASGAASLIPPGATRLSERSARAVRTTVASPLHHIIAVILRGAKHPEGPLERNALCQRGPSRPVRAAYGVNPRIASATARGTDSVASSPSRRAYTPASSPPS